MDFLRNLIKGDKAIWIVFMLLCLTSIIEVFSASSTLTYKSGNHWGPISSHLMMLAIGTIIVIGVHRIPCRWFRAGIILLPISWVMLVSVFIIGSLTNGARRWIDMGLFQFQPSEVAKMATIITVAFLLSKAQEDDGTNNKVMKNILKVTGVTCLLIFTENLSTAVLIAVTVYLMMFIGRVPWKQMLKLSLIAIGAAVIAVSTISLVPAHTWDSIGLHRMTTWQNRFKDHLNPQNIPAAKFNINENAQVAHANIAIATSNVVGKGPGNSVQRDFLSQAFSDFIYAIIIEELGLVGGGFIVILYLFLLIRIGKVARNCDKSFYAFLVIGIGLIIVIQAMFNMLVAVGIMPVTGQPLPLISKGGTSTLINCVYIGIVLSVSKHVNDLKEERREEELMNAMATTEAERTEIKSTTEQN